MVALLVLFQHTYNFIFPTSERNWVALNRGQSCSDASTSKTDYSNHTRKELYLWGVFKITVPFSCWAICVHVLSQNYHYCSTTDNPEVLFKVICNDDKGAPCPTTSFSMESDCAATDCPTVTHPPVPVIKRWLNSHPLAYIGLFSAPHKSQIAYIPYSTSFWFCIMTLTPFRITTAVLLCQSIPEVWYTSVQSVSSNCYVLRVCVGNFLQPAAFRICNLLTSM